MKTTLKMLLMLVVSFAGFISCTDDPASAGSQTETVNVSGSQEIFYLLSSGEVNGEWIYRLALTTDAFAGQAVISMVGTDVDDWAKEIEARIVDGDSVYVFEAVVANGEHDLNFFYESKLGLWANHNVLNDCDFWSKTEDGGNLKVFFLDGRISRFILKSSK